MHASKRPAILSFSIIVLQLFISSNSLGDPNQSVSLSPYESVPRGAQPRRLKSVPSRMPAVENSATQACLDCFSWDIDASGKAEPLTDGLIILRYLFGFTGDALVNGALAGNATRRSSLDIYAFLETHAAQLDVDGDGRAEPLTDGLLLLRYLFGFEASALTTGAISANAQRTETAAITDFIKTRLPETQNDAPAVLQPAWDFAPARAEQVGTNQAAVNGVIDHIFTDTAVQAVLVTKDGYLIGERYSQGYGPDSLGTSWSVAKSFYSAAIGVAIDEGHIASVDQKASDIITEWQGTAKANVTLHHMLQMRSGYSAFDNVFFETDQTAYAIDRPIVRAPGAQFAYSNANSQLFETILRRTTGLSAHDYLSQKILAPIDIDLKAVGLWFDAAGINPLTYCCIDMKAADFARFGLLYARDGQWRGNQILPAEYVESSLTANGWYGYQWWILNAAYFSEESAAIEVAAAQGLNGQYIFVWPEEDVVIVVLSQYSHAVEQGYVVSPTNYPDTCTARNSCPGALGPEVPSFSHKTLVDRMVPLGDTP